MERIDTEEFIRRATKTHGDKYDYSQTIYVDARTKVNIICRKHGEFLQRMSDHVAGSGCKKCVVREPKYPEEYIRGLLAEKGHTLISEYQGISQKHSILCKNNHNWNVALLDIIVKEYNCPECSGNRPHTFETLSSAINNKRNNEYSLVENQEINGVSNKCKIRHNVCGRVFYMRPNSLLNGQGCKVCSDRKYTLTDVETIAKEKHNNIIEVTSSNYKNGNSYCDVKCNCGHEWRTKATILVRGCGCPACVKTGFNPSKPAVFYIFEINGDSSFTGFGISNRYKQRKSDHKRRLKAKFCSITSELTIEMHGETALLLERYIKQTLFCKNSEIEGFKTESVKISTNELQQFALNYLNSACLSYKVKN